jgi:uncharacterized protein with FMN-binding domain
MRRAVPAGIATALGLVALLSFKSSPVTVNRSASAQSAAPSTSAATAPPTPETTPGTAPNRAPSTTPNTTPNTAPAPTTPPTTAAADRTIDGGPFDNQFGTVQVRVTLQGTRITNVTALQMPFQHQRSAEISQQAEPMLQQEALQAQSAQIDLIGGATYTSESYAQSLQSALDKA